MQMVSMPQKMIYATVAIPLYNMGKIAELCFLGLSRQKTNYRWEMIVCEEQNENMYGEEKIRKFSFPNCVQIKYIPIRERISLSVKWKNMAEQAQGLCFLLQAGDDYSHPYRIENTVKAFLKGFNYYDEQKGYFYSFKHKKTIIFNPSPQNAHPCRVNIAWLTKTIKRLPLVYKSTCVDIWMYNSLKNKQLKYIS